MGPVPEVVRSGGRVTAAVREQTVCDRGLSFGDVGQAITRSRFTETEKAFVQSLASTLADGARHALLLGHAHDPDFVDSAGLLILNDRWEVESATAVVGRWMSDFPGGDWD